jgi:hypothetical protein
MRKAFDTMKVKIYDMDGKPIVSLWDKNPKELKKKINEAFKKFE